LENLKRSRTSLLRDLASVDAELKTLPYKQENELSSVDRNLAALEQDRIEVESRREQLLTAPQSGVVTALATDRGKLAIAGQPLLSVIPEVAHCKLRSISRRGRLALYEKARRHFCNIKAFPTRNLARTKRVWSRCRARQ
jgi:membrane fusion protein